MIPAASQPFDAVMLVCSADGEREAQGGEPAAAGQGGRPHVAAARTGAPACQAHVLRTTDPAHLLDKCMSCLLYPVDWCRCTAGQALLICAPSSRGDCTPAAVTDLTAAQQPMAVRCHLTPWHATALLTGNTKRISERCWDCEAATRAGRLRAAGALRGRECRPDCGLTWFAWSQHTTCVS